MSGDSRKQAFLAIGYKAAIVISLAGLLLSALYLGAFLFVSQHRGAAESGAAMPSITAEQRLYLLSTGIFVGMSFGFLGFALFLIQAEGDVDLETSVKDYKLKIARLSPGLFVILCATAIIIACATFRITYTVDMSKFEPNRPGGTDVEPRDIDPNTFLTCNDCVTNETMQ